MPTMGLLPILIRFSLLTFPFTYYNLFCRIFKGKWADTEMVRCLA